MTLRLFQSAVRRGKETLMTCSLKVWVLFKTKPNKASIDKPTKQTNKKPHKTTQNNYSIKPPMIQVISWLIVCFSKVSMALWDLL